MQKLYTLLDKYNDADTAGRQKVKDEIWKQYGQTKAIFVLDMSGFSRLVQRYGILHYLGMVRRMQVACKPIVERLSGSIVKFEADNMFACFDKPQKAIDAAININIAINAMNTMTPEQEDLGVSIGIGFGEILLIQNQDFFGDAVNLASKLGEDVAQKDEILVTENVYEACKDDFQFEKVEITVSGLQLNSYRVKY